MSRLFLPVSALKVLLLMTTCRYLFFVPLRILVSDLKSSRRFPTAVPSPRSR